MKIGIIIDSSSGLTQKEARERKWGYLPLIISIDGKDFKDGIDLTAQDFYRELAAKKSMHTAATPPGIVLEEVGKLSAQNDWVIIYGISQGLSSQTDNIEAIIRDEFKNVVVVKSKSLCYAIVQDLEEIQTLAKTTNDIEYIKEALNEMAKQHEAILVVQSLDWLIQGGRISPTVAKMANLLKIVPLIKMENGKLEKHGVGRVFRKAVVKGFEDLYQTNGKNVDYTLYHGNSEMATEFLSQAEKVLDRKIELRFLPSVIAIHTGPGVIALQARKLR